MPEFASPIDIGNRAAQIVGADKRMSATGGFSDTSKVAREVSFCYGKLRRAELRRRCWTFATRRTALYARTATTMLLAPTVWSSTTTYFVGSIVDDGTGTYWISRVPTNLNNQPTRVTGAPSTAWEPYFGSLTADVWTSATTYQVGDLAYTTPGDGTYKVYLSLINANTDTPSTATAWSATTTYMQNQVVTASSVAYMSLIDFNLNQTPSASPAAWASGTTYASGNTVCGSDGVIYTSKGNGNVGHDPTTTAGVYWSTAGVLCPWTTVFTASSGSMNWREIGGSDFPAGVALAECNVLYPQGTGPVTQTGTMNAYRLPSGFLRKAPQDPKAGDFSFLGAPSNLVKDDWKFEGDWLITWDSNPIIFRFIADVQDVTKFDDMFCEGLAARIGTEICYPITNSVAKLQDCRHAYDKAMGEARLVDAIEEGSEQPALDDYIACRI